MPKLYGFFSQEAMEFLGDSTLYYYNLATTGEKIAVTHFSEDESGADYFWKDKVSIGELVPKDTKRLWDIPRPWIRVPAPSSAMINFEQINQTAAPLINELVDEIIPVITNVVITI